MRVRRPLHRLLVFDLDHVERARRAPARRGVEQHDRVVAVLHGEGEVHAANPEIAHLDAGGQLVPTEPVGQRDAEPVISEEYVADPGDEDAPRGYLGRRRLSGNEFDLVRGEEEAMPGLARQPQVAARIVLHDDRQRHPPLEVLLDRLDHRGIDRWVHPQVVAVHDQHAGIRREAEQLTRPRRGVGRLRIHSPQ